MSSSGIFFEFKKNGTGTPSAVAADAFAGRPPGASVQVDAIIRHC
jgi:hypothetical protein